MTTDYSNVLVFANVVLKEFINPHAFGESLQPDDPVYPAKTMKCLGMLIMPHQSNSALFGRWASGMVEVLSRNELVNAVAEDWLDVTPSLAVVLPYADQPTDQRLTEVCGAVSQATDSRLADADRQHAHRRARRAWRKRHADSIGYAAYSAYTTGKGIRNASKPEPVPDPTFTLDDF
jgi:hypothetical protein